MYGQPSGYQPPQAAYGAPSQGPSGYQAPSGGQQYGSHPPTGAPAYAQQGYGAQQPNYGSPNPYQTQPHQPSAYQPPMAAYGAPSGPPQQNYQPPSQIPQNQPYQGAPKQYQPTPPPSAYPPPSSMPQPSYGAPSQYQPPVATHQPPSSYPPPSQVGYQAPPPAPYGAPPPGPYGAPGLPSQIPGPVYTAPSAYPPPQQQYVTSPGMVTMAPQQQIIMSPPPTVIATPTTLVKTTFVTYGDGTIFNVPSRWTIKQVWGWSDMYIKDEWGNDVFYADAKNYAYTQNLGFTDLRTGIQIAYIREKLKLGMPKFSIYQGSSETGTISQKLTLINPKFTVQSLSGTITIHGNWTAHSFTFSRGMRQIAKVHRDGCSGTDTYYVSIQPGEDVIFILACCIVIDKCTTIN